MLLVRVVFVVRKQSAPASASGLLNVFVSARAGAGYMMLDDRCYDQKGCEGDGGGAKTQANPRAGACRGVARIFFSARFELPVLMTIRS